MNINTINSYKVANNAVNEIIKIRKEFFEDLLIEQLGIIDKLYEEVCEYVTTSYEFVDTYNKMLSSGNIEDYTLKDVKGFLNSWEKLENITLKVVNKFKSEEFILAVAEENLLDFLDALKSQLNGSKKENEFIFNMVKNKLYKQNKESCQIIIEECRNKFQFVEDFNEIFKLRKEIENEFSYLIEISNNNSSIETTINRKYHRFACTYDSMALFLNSIGFTKIRQNGTSHAIFKNDKGVSIPLPNKKSSDMAPQTISLILKEVGCNRNDLASFLAKN